MSNYLFADPSFLTGMGRVLDVGGVFDDYNISDTPAQADARAMRCDRAATAADLLEGVDIVTREADGKQNL